MSNIRLFQIFIILKINFNATTNYLHKQDTGAETFEKMY